MHINNSKSHNVSVLDVNVPTDECNEQKGARGGPLGALVMFCFLLQVLIAWVCSIHSL